MSENKDARFFEKYMENKFENIDEKVGVMDTKLSKVLEYMEKMDDRFITRREYDEFKKNEEKSKALQDSVIENMKLKQVAFGGSLAVIIPILAYFIPKLIDSIMR